MFPTLQQRADALNIGIPRDAHACLLHKSGVLIKNGTSFTCHPRSPHEFLNFGVIRAIWMSRGGFERKKLEIRLACAARPFLTTVFNHYRSNIVTKCLQFSAFVTPQGIFVRLSFAQWLYFDSNNADLI
ncbi:hypothetical protein CEXT_135721 [Caerostris extrusa]|uniref:Uncharacterized protein n=1 Tax=Caerostris extrusa TaxID=172846 RepID=A0AAV4M8T5_CAEEX|nr:hypothetical protein CEXT_135721 [Caerostris extrusa]